MNIKRVEPDSNEKTRYAVYHEGALLGYVSKRHRYWFVVPHAYAIFTRSGAIRRLAMDAGINIPYEYKPRKRPILPIKRQHPAGRFEYETNDCTVCALANATPLTYSESHAILKAEGRPDRKGFHFKAWIKYHASKVLPGFKFVSVFDWINSGLPDDSICGGRKTRNFTLNQFMASKPQGNYIVMVKRHTFAVIDGVIIDRIYNGARKHIEQIYKVEMI